MLIVVGTLHEYQRHQDTMADREQIRAELDQRLHEIIAERAITLIAEEAGDDTAVWEHLKQQDELVGGFGGLLGESSRTVDEPVPTIAKRIATDTTAEITHVDIRVDPNEFPFVEQRDERMAMKIMGMSKTAENILVIVGVDHLAGVARLLKDAGLSVESFSFPEGLR